jgi:hypothetical protein
MKPSTLGKYLQSKRNDRTATRGVIDVGWTRCGSKGERKKRGWEVCDWGRYRVEDILLAAFGKHTNDILRRAPHETWNNLSPVRSRCSLIQIVICRSKIPRYPTRNGTSCFLNPTSPISNVQVQFPVNFFLESSIPPISRKYLVVPLVLMFRGVEDSSPSRRPNQTKPPASMQKSEYSPVEIKKRTIIRVLATRC